MSIAKKLVNAGIKNTPPRKPLWQGPEKDGITFSMLSRFLVCRERFRIYFIEGLQSAPMFNQRLEYGNMWHACEEGVSAGGNIDYAFSALESYTVALGKTYPQSGEQIRHWYNVCKVQFPIYLQYWGSGTNFKGYKQLVQESVFDVPYKLPSGRMVRLRGKWDSIYKDKGRGIWLQENKTKGDIQPEQLRRQLTFDLQTMMYVSAFQSWQKLDDYGEPIRTPELTNKPIQGILYNVVRRPLSGGKHSIRQHAPTKNNPRGEPSEGFYKRLGKLIEEDCEFFFMRWEIGITQQDIEKFRNECLNPILEQLCEWWDWIKGNPNPFDYNNDPSSRLGMIGIHWRYPFGVYNVLDEGGSTDLDQYLADGNPTGLTRVEKLFPELQ
jgi:hypothetical protein